ncbi:phage portal protein [Fusobacterium ulcerans]|uniref:Phage portal protein, lambda family n=1 Tax=Fusobacterium ulcerans TaxID=861 RepID=A0AAX2JBB4_9FUSO|nr:phage portal protein [Fusobacterium ulcerans]AVQ29479.1 phage portal protein [Fusobacterium ulcerans]EFS27022.1 lambda family phage portal protein [Fusobacterium ulcerans ATCC 49185]SQJ03960.1 phage portal protein, lambda family [Fusobacterium ulcerans]
MGRKRKKRVVQVAKNTPREVSKTSTTIKMVSGIGYNNKDDPSLSKWYTYSESPDNDILWDLDDLRAKSRNLYMNNELAGAALKKMRTKIVGTGLLPKPTINYQIAGITKEKAKEYEKIIKAKFNAWASSTNADFNRMHDFFTIQALIQLSWIMNGDAFIIPKRKKRAGVEIDLCLQMIEADRVVNPRFTYNQLIKGGVEFSENGDLLKYYIADRHPGDGYSEIKGYPVFNNLGRRNILHIFEPERIGQRRGVPLLASIIYPIKNLGKYKEAELIAAVINASLGFIVETKDPENFINGSAFGSSDSDTDGEAKKERTDKISLEHGMGIIAKEGETIKEFTTTRPNKSYKEFVDAVYEEIGAQLEIPHEVLMSSFKASYSAAKASLEEAHQRFLVCRKLLERTLCQPIYEEFILELIRNGDVDCPNFFENEVVRYAFTRCIWVGSGKSSLDPLKEANANKTSLDNYTTTRGIIAAESGLDFDEMLEARLEEEIKIAEIQKKIKEEIKGGEINV